MTAHTHAALMAEYAKDALETETPWDLWEHSNDGDSWFRCSMHPSWKATTSYRRKTVPLCQVEGRDVFPGDKLWHISAKRWISVSRIGAFVGYLESPEYGMVRMDRLAWTEPARTKTVYQWAFRAGADWKCSRDFYADKQAAQSGVGFLDVRRLDYTALEVPA